MREKYRLVLAGFEGLLKVLYNKWKRTNKTLSKIYSSVKQLMESVWKKKIDMRSFERIGEGTTQLQLLWRKCRVQFQKFQDPHPRMFFVYRVVFGFSFPNYKLEYLLNSYIGIMTFIIQEEFQICLNTMKGSSWCRHSTGLVDYCKNLFGTAQLFYIGGFVFWIRRRTVIRVVVEDEEKVKKLSNKLTRFSRMI